MRVHRLNMEFSSPWSQGLRGGMHITAAGLECFYGEHLLFQQKCMQQAKSILEVPWASYSHPKCCRPHTSMERGVCEEREATQPDYLACPLTFPIISCNQPLLSPQDYASPICAPKRCCKQLSLSLKENLQDLVDLQHRRSQDSGKICVSWATCELEKIQCGQGTDTDTDSVLWTCISVVSSSKDNQGRPCPATWPYSWSRRWFLGIWLMQISRS